VGSFKASLTPRRRVALETLRKLAVESSGGVHYSLVASSMGISSWTAYAMLRDLERSGLAERGYAPATSARSGGRSRIVFRPTGRTVTLGSEVIERLGAAVERFAAIADEKLAARLYLADSRRDPGDDILVHLGYWMGRLEAAGRGAQEAARALLEGNAGPSAKIQGLSTMGLGTILAGLGRSRLAARITSAATGFVSRLDDAQRAPEGMLSALVEAASALQSTRSSKRRLLVP